MCIRDRFIIEGSMAGGHLGFGADDITQGKTQSNDEILSDILAVIEESGACLLYTSRCV